MIRRDFLKAVSAFVAVVAVAPETLTTQPVDWLEWNEIGLRYADGEIRSLSINQRDFTHSREARRILADVVAVREDGLFVGDVKSGHGTVVPVSSVPALPTTFTLGFWLRVQPPSSLPSCSVNGSLVKSSSWVSDLLTTKGRGAW